MSGKHVRPRRWWAVGGAVLTVLALVAVVLVVTHQMHGSTRAAGSTTSIPTPTPTSSSPSSTPPRAPSSTRPPSTATHKPAVMSRAAVDGIVGKLSKQLPAGGVSVAVLNTRTHARYAYGATSGMRAGSVYKLLVLETLLLQRQDAGSRLSDDDLELATPMIENSDNVAAYQLFLRVGGRDGLGDGAKRLGLTHTVVGQADPAVTTTSAQDFLLLLAALEPAGKASKLSQYSRSAALNLMQHVESDQRWGVGAVADPGTTFANKNGWLSVDNTNGPGENDNGLWLVNSVGVVMVHHQQVLMAVFTQHGRSYEDGVELVESLAKAITRAVVAS
jgi:beta-lactamase class A